METHTGEIWIEKYRPHSLKEMVGQPRVVPLLEAYVARRTLPHLLFAGPPGTGKTTAALALARDLYGGAWRDSFLELNASDERGIETVRNTIKSYVRSAPMASVPFKLLFLDEADQLTNDAQASLRRMMERYSASSRFILSCNYSSRIIEPIQSRCAVFRFKTFGPEEMRGYLGRIARSEGRQVEPEAMESLIKLADGDLRRAVNLLQLASALTERITADSLYESASTPLPREVEQMMGKALSGDFEGSRAALYALLTDRGASGEDVVRALHRHLPNLSLPEEEKIALLQVLAEVDFRLAMGASDRVQLEAFLARLGLSGRRGGDGTA
jgi:replication factor C small subunit